MYLILVLIIIVCVLLGFIVLIQNPKGGGLASNFSSSSQLMGVKKTGDFLEKGTWALAIGLMVLTIATTVMGKSGTGRADNSANHEANQKASRPVNGGSSIPFGSPAAQPAGGAQQQPTTPAPTKKP